MKFEPVTAYRSTTGSLHPTMLDAAKQSLISLKRTHSPNAAISLDWPTIYAILDNADLVIEILTALKQQGDSHG